MVFAKRCCYGILTSNNELQRLNLELRITVQRHRFWPLCFNIYSKYVIKQVVNADVERQVLKSSPVQDLREVVGVKVMCGSLSLVKR